MKGRDAVLLFSLAALWGSSFAFIRVAVPAFGPMTLVGFRVAVAAVLLAALAAVLRRSVDVRQYAGRLLVLGAMNAAVPFSLISAAELELTASLAALLNATTPMFAAGFDALWMGERFTRRRAAGLAAGLAGVAVMVGWSPIPLTVPVLLAVGAMLLASASYAASGFYVKKRLSGAPTHTLALGQQLGALVWLAVPAVVWAPASDADRCGAGRGSGPGGAVDDGGVPDLLPAAGADRSDADIDGDLSAARVRHAVGSAVSGRDDYARHGCGPGADPGQPRAHQWGPGGEG
jgi:drug/metabolite transporter (DMT)-like permease